jgi:hypothetical protein
VQQRNQAGWLKRAVRTWPVPGLLLVLFTLFGALVQAGVVAPKFTSTGSGEDGDTYSVSLTNTSWLSWTVTGARLAGGGVSRVLPDESSVGLGEIYLGKPVAFPGKLPAVSTPVEVATGQSITLTLVRMHTPECKQDFSTTEDPEKIATELASHAIVVPAVVSVATPFGSRKIDTNFNLSYGCP